MGTTKKVSIADQLKKIKVLLAKNAELIKKAEKAIKASESGLI